MFKLNQTNKNLLVNLFKNPTNWTDGFPAIIGINLARYYNGYSYHFRLYRQHKLTGQVEHFDLTKTNQDFVIAEHLFDYYIDQKPSKVKVNDWSFIKISVSKELNQGFMSTILTNPESI